MSLYQRVSGDRNNVYVCWESKSFPEQDDATHIFVRTGYDQHCEIGVIFEVISKKYPSMTNLTVFGGHVYLQDEKSWGMTPQIKSLTLQADVVILRSVEAFDLVRVVTCDGKEIETRFGPSYVKTKTVLPTPIGERKKRLKVEWRRAEKAVEEVPRSPTWPI